MIKESVIREKFDVLHEIDIGYKEPIFLLSNGDAIWPSSSYYIEFSKCIPKYSRDKDDCYIRYDADVKKIDNNGILSDFERPQIFGISFPISQEEYAKKTDKTSSFPSQESHRREIVACFIKACQIDSK